MHHIAKVVTIAVGAICFGMAMASAHRLAFEDALLDRLDRPTVASVMSYVDDTWLSRSIGFFLVAGLSAAAGIMVDRLVDLARKGLPNS